MQLNKYAVGAGPEFACSSINDQLLPKIQNFPGALPIQYLTSIHLGLDGDPTASGMSVNGSSVNKNFEYVVPASKFLILAEINLIIVDASITIEKFGGISALTNGCLWQVLNANDVEQYSFGAGKPIKQNYEFYHNPGADLRIGSGSDQERIILQ